MVVGDAFDTFFGHTTEMATYYGWCIPLSDMMKWYNWRAPESAVSVKEGIDNLLGRKGKDYVETLMRDSNGQGRAETASGGKRLIEFGERLVGVLIAIDFPGFGHGLVQFGLGGLLELARLRG